MKTSLGPLKHEAWKYDAMCNSRIQNYCTELLSPVNKLRVTLSPRVIKVNILKTIKYYRLEREGMNWIECRLCYDTALWSSGSDVFLWSLPRSNFSMGIGPQRRLALSLISTIKREGFRHGLFRFIITTTILTINAH